MTGASLVRPKPTGRVTPFASSRGAALDPLDPPPSPLPPPLPLRLPFTSSRPAYTPNPAIPFLQRVHASSDPAKLDRLIAGLGRSLAWAGLGAAVAAVIASAFVFGTPASSSSRSVAVQIATAPAAPPPASAKTEPVRTLSEAITVLESFLTTASALTRHEMIEPTEPLSDPLARDERIPALAATSIDRENARLHHHPPLTVALVPITDANGLPRTAAIVHKGDRWRIDWRSVLTPETRDWEAFARGSTRGVSQYRVHVSRQPDGAWTVSRSANGHDPVVASAALGSRVAEELEAELAARGGAPLSADLFLDNSSGTPLNIVDWTRDKWSL